MRPVEIIPGMGEVGIKENSGGGKFNCDLCMNFVNVTMYPQHNKVLYHLSHSTTPFFMLGIFKIGSCKLFAQDWLQTVIFLISAS
jgi:hypothetical protein